MIRFRRFATAAAALLLVVAASVPAVSAQGFNAEQMRQRMLAQVDGAIEALSLEGSVADTVRAILIERAGKRAETFQSMRQGGGQNRDAVMQAMAKLDEETATKLGAVLSEEQVAAWKKYEEEQRGQMRRRRGQ